MPHHILFLTVLDKLEQTIEKTVTSSCIDMSCKSVFHSHFLASSSAAGFMIFFVLLIHSHTHQAITDRSDACQVSRESEDPGE